MEKKLKTVRLSYQGKPQFVKESAERLKRLASQFYNNKVKITFNGDQTQADIEALYDEANFQNDLTKIGGLFYQAMGGFEE